MKPTTILPIILIGAISLQCLLALRQGKSLGDTFSQMRTKGNVLVGKHKTHFRGGAYIFFNIDSAGCIEDAKVISGSTIFSTVKSLPECVGKDISSLRFKNRNITKAYEDAVARYREELEKS